MEAYDEWVQWIALNEPKTYQKLSKPIDILIATDALSEGQNLQDCEIDSPLSIAQGLSQ